MHEVAVDRIGRLSPAKQRLLQQKLRQKAAAQSPPPIGPSPLRGTTNRFPCSFAQQRLWFLQQLEPDSFAYNVPSSLRLSGPLAAPALAEALTEVVRRHEVLRTTFEADEAPVQVVHPAAPICVPVVDLAELAGPARRNEARRLLREALRRPFDLARGPLFRVALLALEPEEHYLLLTLHHIVIDALSTGILARELGALYQGFLAGRPALLPALAIQYADFAHWQRQWLSGEVLETEVGHWRQCLEGMPPVLELPADRRRPTVASGRGSVCSLSLPAAEAAALQAVARRQGTTPFMAVLAVFQLLLSRYAGRDDVPVGTPTSGRNQLQVEGLIGFFVNMLVLRTHLAGAATFLDLLDRVRSVTLGAYAHQELPFEKLVAELQPERNLGHHPLFQAMLSLDPEIEGGARPEGLRLSWVEQGGTAAKLDLALNLTLGPSGAFGAFTYAVDLFEATTMARMAGHLVALLEAVAAGPERPLASLSPWTRGELHQMLVEWNETADGAAPPASVPERFAAHARRVPDAVALVCEDERLSYSALDVRSARLAARLLALGVGPEVRVALCAERSLDLEVGLLAVLRAGGAYVPLDPELPRERLAFLLADAGGPVLLTQRSLLSQLPVAATRAVLLLDEGGDAGADASEGQAEAAGPPAPDSAAYVIYTSGSTGRPKGVVVEHRHLASYVDAALRLLDLPAGASYATVSTAAADLGHTVVFTSLCTGGALHVISRARLGDPEAMAEYFERHPVDCLKIVPSHLAALHAGAAGGRLLPRRALVLGGEASRWPLVESLGTLANGCRILNHYGPTETTVGVVAGPADLRDAVRTAVLPLGRPLARTRIYVLDRDLVPVPLGVPGELCVGGAQVARGYLGRPDLTAERFVPDPFAGASGARLYRTGDRARHLRDGRLEFLGRVDDQVKVRGFRVEPREVEASLRAHPAIREAVVMALVEESEGGGEESGRRLAAYVAAAEDAPAPAELRAFLQGSLPDYMVPATFVMLAALPLTRNGKVDRQALARLRPALEHAGADGGRTTPRNRREEVLAAIWKQVLRLDEVGVDDNFFSLGGDSILSIQVISRARQAGLRLTPRQVFEHPTVAGLAAVAVMITAPASEEEPVAGPVPLTPIQVRFFARALPRCEHHNQSVLLEIRPPEGEARIEPRLLWRALDRLPAHHDALRTRFEPPAEGRPSWRQIVEVEPEPVPAVQVDLSAVLADRRRPELEAVAARLQGSLDLGRPPLLRAALFSPGEGIPDRLLLVSHHLIVDGVSWRILLEDLETAYRQLARGGEGELPPRTISWRRWAEHLVEHARSAAVQGQAAYWRALLQAPATRLPVDRGDGPNDVASSRVFIAALDADETRALLQEVPRSYRTQINDALLTALVEAFAAWTGSRRLLVDLEGHGREEIAEGLDTSRTVGWFTAIHPVLLDLDGITPPGAALKAVKERLRSVPDRGLGYGLLRYLGEGEPAAELCATPDVIFNYLGQLDSTVAEDRMFRGAAESPGPSRSPLQPRPYLLEVSASVAGGRLRTSWIYSANRHLSATVEALADGFLAALKRLVAHCHTAEAGFTPSDFPLARLDQESLDRIVAAAPGGLEDVYPTSPMQQGMLFHTLQAPESGVYVEQLGLLLEESLDVAAFENAWQQVVDRHAILRTSFAGQSTGTPLQVVHARVRLAWDRHDWRELSPAEQRSRWAAFLEADRRQGFAVEAVPLMRLALIRLGERRYRFLWSHHHVLLDGWSSSLLLREVFRLYEARLRHEPARLEPPRPFRDYIAWLERQDLAAAEGFWRRVLSGFSAPTPLAVDRPAAAAESLRSSRELLLSAAATGELRAFARRHGLTLSIVMHGAWAALLSRYSGETDVFFGTVTSGRSAPLPGIEEIVGIFINTLPMRVEISGVEVAAWLKGLQERQAEASQFEHTPLVQVQGWSDLPRGRAMFESILAFDNYPVDQATEQQAGRQLGVTQLDASEQTNYALSVVVSVATRWSLKILFDAARFHAVTVDRMLCHLQSLLAGMLDAGEQAVGSLPLLTEAERLQLLEWNATAAEIPSAELTLAELFEARADRAPETPAVLGAEGESLTFGEVEARANRLANLLARLGAGPGELVAVQLDRSPAMVEALLGIAKSGAAYVPLETAYPESRVRWILDRMRVRAMVLGRATLELVLGLAPELPALRHLICLEPATAPALPPGVRLWEPADVRSYPATRPAGLAGPDDLAYVIFTSGSTGEPKGVMVRHRPAANLIDWVNRTFGMGPGDRVLFITSLCFDLSVYDVFGVLAAGGSVRVAGREEMEEPRSLVRLLAAEPITFWDSAPAALQQLVPFLPEAVAGGGGEALRLVFLSGDWVPLPLPGQIRTSFPGARVIALGGATEATVWSNFFPVEEVAPEWRSLPYGRPIQNARYYVLNGRLDSCPIGVPGDLYIAGGCLSSGYAAAPELTADRFMPDPLAAEPGAVMYRTGDRARFLADGNMEFLGRLDHQVKVRGFRIELGEIEAALAQHPGVREAVALAREGSAGDKRLVAYVIPAEAAPAPGELRAHLEERLPEYMVPSAFVFLDAWPVTPNGKLDRKALPEPEGSSGESYLAPRDPFEEVLAAIFCELLRVEQAGPRDNFFALGGHSLLATQLVSRVRESFGIELPLRAIFDAACLADLAVAVREELRTGGEAPRPPVAPAPRDRPLPLSFAQQRMWFLDQLGPAAGVYHIPLALRVHGPLRPEALAAALTEVVRRHQALRTTFRSLDGELVQVVSPPAAFPLPLIDLAAQPEPARRSELQRLAREAEALRFDLERGPLLRAVLVVLGEEERALLLTLHHIAGDGWSMGRLVQELGALYGAALAGRPSPLPEVRLQYPDFAVWQRLWLAGEGLERELAHWRTQLGPDAGEPLPLPFDRPRPAVPSARGGIAAFEIPTAQAEAVQSFSRSRSATLFMTVLAAFQVLLARCCGTPSVSVGTPVAGRGLLWAEDLIGLFVNTLVLRTDLSGDPSFAQALARVREIMLQAFAHQDLPFELLVEDLQPDRSLSHQPLFQVMFTLDSSPLSPPDLPGGLTLEPLARHRDESQFELSLSMTLADGRLVGAVGYRRDLFDAATIRRMQRHLVTLLEAAVADPGRPLSSLALLPAEERHQLLLEWNDTRPGRPEEPLHRRIALQAARTPEAVALSFGAEHVTYRELDERSSQLARRLQRLGVGPEVPVGLCAHRSPELLVGLLGVLKAGGVHVPLDPSYPPDRLSYLLEDSIGRSAAPVLLTAERLAPLFAPGGSLETEGLAVIRLDADWGGVSHEERHAPAAHLSPDNLAYLIYTSGSTGLPKGVAVPHRGLALFCAAQARGLGVSPGDRVFQFVSPSFDIFLWDTSLALGSGAELCLAREEDLLPGPGLVRLLGERSVSVATLPPSVLAALPQERLPALHTIAFGGEACSPALAHGWQPGRRLVNSYGPAEATIAVTLEPLEEGAERMALGFPLAGSRFYVLGRSLGLLPAGASGELCIAGTGVARGYLGRPDLTAEAFVPDPFGGPGERIYRTGDLVRRLPDGELAFLGRIDHQLKIRGFRVEPGEIESRLAALPGVHQAVIAAWEDLPGGRGLVAWVVPEEETAPTAGELRSLLREVLPDYMVPAHFVFLSALPLTPNGKVDRRALPSPEVAAAGELDVARTPMEELLAGIFAELLGLEGVGVNQGFFDLGGHSLLATRVVSRVRQTCGVELPLRALFESPTPAGLAAAVEQALLEREGLELPPLEKAPRHGPLPLSFAQERLWFLDRLEPGNTAFSNAIAVQAEGSLDPAALAAAVRELSRRHEPLRTAFGMLDGRPVQMIAPPGTVASLPVIDLLGLPTAVRRSEARRLVRSEGELPFDLSRAPLVRWRLVRSGERESLIVLAMHHIISDAWSMSVLVREMQVLYEACSRRIPSPLAELPLQYADFAVWQRRWLSGEALAAELDSWRRRLAGARFLLELPADRPRPPVRSYRGAGVPVRLSGEAEGLRRLAREEQATLFMVLMAGFQVLLGRYSGQSDFCVGTPIAGRRLLETEGLIGFFVNTLVLRADLSGGLTFRDVVGRVREAALNAYAHQDLPFEKLVEELQPQRDMAHSPIYQAAVTFQNAPAVTLEVPALRFSPVDTELRTVQVDLHLFLGEAAGRIDGRLQYATALFDATTAQRISAHLQAVLAAAVADPGRAVADLPVWTQAELHQTLHEWNDTAEAVPWHGLEEAFDGWAARAPDAVAVVYGERSVSYGELDRRADRLARHLRDLGVGPEVPVGLHLERSDELAVAFLAVLKAGGSCLPLDPAYPEDRLDHMLSDSGLLVLLTQERLAASLPRFWGFVVRLDAEGEIGEAPASSLPEDPPDPGGIAYVIYTSGSTGRAKGVMVPHRGLANLAGAQARLFGLGPGDRVLQFASPSFDASVWEIAMSLSSGAAICLADGEDLLPGPGLARLLREREITAATLPPSALAALPEEGLPALATLVVAGEACPSELARRWARGRRLVNGYGPTEASVCASAADFEAESGRLTLGRPLGNVHLHVLDPEAHPVPTGAVGELCIAGAGLARGYRGRPDSTAAAFVPDPFGPHGARLYRSGDLARRLAGGELDFLGRADQQVKVRGFRIEPGEIEEVLAESPQVRLAAVVIRDDLPGGRGLAAFVVPEEGREPAAGELRELLLAKLPEYMLPAHLVVVAGLPSTPNGKVDRKALQYLDLAGGWDAGRARTPPRNPAEELLADAFAEVLGVDEVGTDDDFFELGGHSLLATRLISAVRDLFGVDLQVRTVFEAPTVAALARHVGGLRPGDAAPPLVRVPRTGELPLSFAQQRLWFLDRLVPDNAFYNVFSAMPLAGNLDVAALARAFCEIARRHEALRTTFPTVDGRPVQAIAAAPSIALPVADLDDLSDSLRRAELDRLAREESRRPFDLGRGPLLRLTLVRAGDGGYLLLVCLHHIVADGWSSAILLRELSILYDAFSQGLSSPLPELPIQYADFAVWQRGWLQGEVLERQMAYWREQLAGAPRVLELPHDRPRPAIETFRGSHEPLPLSPSLGRGIQSLSRHSSATPFMVLLASFAVLLGRYAGQTDIPIGTGIANRNRREVEGLIGFFVNTLVLRIRLDGRASFRQLLTAAREVALGAYEHEDLPFEMLVDELQLERDPSHHPLAQAMLVSQNFQQPALPSRGGKEAPPQDLARDSGTSKVDLALFISGGGEGMQGILEYNSDLFETTTARRLMEHLVHLVEAAVAEPEAAIAALPLLSEPQRHQLVQEWSGLHRADRPGMPVHRRFRLLVESAPAAPALLFEEEALTYGQLGVRVERLARHIQSLGAGPEVRVGVALERSIDAVAAVLAIWSTGAVYVPLDPSYPKARLSFMVKDAGLSFLLTQPAARDLVPPDPEVPVISLDRLPQCPAVGELEGLAGHVDPDNLAYVIYTSGSTGRPKGVGLTHRGLSSLSFQIQRRFELGFGSRLLQFASLGFDGSVFEIAMALSTGACLCVAPRRDLLPGPGLVDLLRRRRITHLVLPPSALAALGEADLPELANLAVAGEAPTAELVEHWAPGRRFFNGYGPTENTVTTTLELCCPGAGKPVLGRPLAYIRAYLLDESLHPVPPGKPAELFIGGDGLARGYLGRPDLTADRFVPDLFAVAPGERLYRTGDLVRHRSSGVLDFLGRIDQQVKVRGFRIELGEIEEALRTHSAVYDCAVMHEQVAGSERLVAYFVQTPDPANRGREALQEQQVSQWKLVFNEFYDEDLPVPDPTFNITGWNSSYTGLPLTIEEMEEWLEDTVQRILSLGPRRVLEIGCGSGLLLFRVAPRCEAYYGTDISSQALAYVQAQLGRRPDFAARVHLAQRPADRFEGVEEGTFDLVILNSVAQYFPSAAYLAEVLRGAVKAVRPGGAVFLGDLRSLPLLDAFHASVELQRAEPRLPLHRVRGRLQSRRLEEEELVVAPGYFAALQHGLPAIGRVEVHLKRGRSKNELLGFRYQVVLRVGETLAVHPPRRLDWRREGLSLESLHRRLAAEAPEVVVLCNVPNARTASAVAAARGIGDGEESEPAGELRDRLSRADVGVEPQDLWDLARHLPYDVELGWASHGPEGSFEAALVRRDVGIPPATLLSAPALTGGELSLQRYANDPLQGRAARRLIPELRTFLAERLPDYMIPALFVPLDTLPLTASGKVDRRSLPAPDQVQPTSSRFVAPRTPTEELLAEIFSELLRVDGVGIESGFFDLGGHSLLATQLVARVRNAFGVELEVRSVFESPTVAALASAVDEARHAGRGRRPPIEPVPHDGPLPLSFSQQRLWFLDQLEPGSPVYNMPLNVLLEGGLHAEALARALAEVVRRHEVLRTTFGWEGEEPVQRIAPAGPFPLSLCDLAGLPGRDREREADRLARREALRPFDLGRGPLLRGALLALGAESHRLLLTMHHIVSDGWSMGVLLREIEAAYAAFREGRPSPLPALPIQYADFAVWQRRWLSGGALAGDLEFWRRRLGGVAPLDLPTDRPRPAVQRFEGESRGLALGKDLVDALLALSRSRGATLFMTLLAALQGLLARSTGKADVSVGSPIAGRSQTQIEGMVGFFVNTLVLRTDLSGDPTFLDLLGRVREVTLDAYAHQDIPFERLVEDLKPERDLARSPLFQVMFGLQNVADDRSGGGALLLRTGGVGNEPAKFDLTLSLTAGPQWVRGSLNYATALFDATTVERLLVHLQRLLAAAVASSEARLSDLPLLDEAERQALMVEWSDTAMAGAADGTVHGLFERQAMRAPDAAAVTCGEQVLTYGALERQANRLARRLRRLGVAPDTRVAVLLERSPEMIVGLLGILKAGGAYVPLDPSSPAGRSLAMVEDSRAAILLSEDRLAAALPWDGATVLWLDAERAVLAEEAADAPPPLAGPRHLAYVLFTSGSTGRPKGVQVAHGAMVNFLASMARRPGLDRGDVLVAITTLSFDIAGLEVFLPLSRGAVVALADRETGADPARLTALLEASQATALQATPATWQLLLGGGWAGSRHLVALCGGEAMTPSLAAELRGRVRELWNVYGPTETTIWSTLAPVEEARWTVPVGRPLGNTRIQVLDGGWQPVPLGVVGELCIGGAGLARGYSGRPDLTGERFIPDPGGSEPGGRLYRTGDLARWLIDGTIEVLGRIDHQVKVRGHRIEPGEVEAALAGHPAVRQAAVVARDDRLGRALVAYLVTEESLDPAELRQYLRRRLPDFMIPSRFISLDALPMTPSGKVDRRALPAPEAAARGASRTRPPRNGTELALLRIWEGVLDVRPIGVGEDFFDLGGHSLLAARLMAQIQRRLGRALPVAELFRGATIEHLAAVLERGAEPLPHSCLLPLGTGGDLAPFFCVHPASGGALCFRPLAQHLGPGLPVYGIQARGRDPGQQPLSRIEDMAHLYVEAVRAVQPDGPYHLGGWSFGGLVAYEMARLLVADGREVAALLLFDTVAPQETALQSLQEEPEDEDQAGILAFFGAEAGLPLVREDLSTLSSEEQLRSVAGLAVRSGFIPESEMESAIDYLERFVAVCRHSARAAASYRPSPYPGRVTLVRAASPAQLELDSPLADPLNGWGRLATEIEVCEVAALHHKMMSEPDVGEVAEVVHRRLVECHGGRWAGGSPPSEVLVASEE